MARKYSQTKRAEQAAETRQRIVEAAVDLHGSVGPVQTTVSMIAERAGVQRHTYYSHFPEERSLFMACSGHAMERDPLPDPDAWRKIEDPLKRLAAGLGALYDWYRRNAELTACVLRDGETHELTREMNELRMGPVMQTYAAVLGGNLGQRQRAALALALCFFTWRTLVRDAGLTRDEAIEVMVRAVDCAGRGAG